MKQLLAYLSIVLLCSTAYAQNLTPTRIAHVNMLTSVRDPGVRIELPNQVKYVGADRWILYDVADCEIHVFVEADEQKNVKRLYWLQFEGYLPSKPELRYNYSSETITNAGMEFFVKARFGPTTETPRAGSDAERVQSLLQAGGYKLPPEMMNVRFVHLLDKQKRQELMIIYAEDLASTGHSTSQLLPGAPAHEKWAAISAGLIQRAIQSMSLHKIARP